MENSGESAPLRYQKLRRNDTCIYVFKANCVQVIIYSADEILDESLVQSISDDLHWSLYCLTKAGNVYRMCDSQAITIKSVTPKDEHDADIFTDLLSTEDDEEETGISLQLTTRPVYILQPSDLILNFTDKALQLSVTNNIISVLTNEKYEYLLYIFEISEQFEESLDVNKQRKCLKFSKTDGQTQERESTCKELLKIVAINNESERLVHSTDLILLESDLFSTLFGKDATILRLPVILLCLPEGSVFFTPTSSFRFHDSQQMGNNGAELTQKVNSKPDSNWKLLFETATHITDILQVSFGENLERSDNSEHMTSLPCTHTLVICSKGGLVITYFVNQDESSAIVLSEFVVTSPVVAVNSFYNRLYHSTGSRMHETRLSLTQVGKNCKPSITVSGTKIFQYAGVERLSCKPAEGFSVHQDCPCQLTYVTGDGHMTDITSTEFGEDTCLVTGGQIRDVLLSMEKVDAERQRLQRKLLKQDYQLQQINIATALIRRNLLTTPQTSSRKSVPEVLGKGDEKVLLSCVSSTKLYTANGEKEIQLILEITNQSRLTLSHDWRFVVRVLPQEGTSSQIAVFSVSQAVKDDFKHNDTLSVTVSVPPELILAGFTAEVTAVLALNETDSSRLSSQVLDNTACLSALIYREDLDVLHFLLPNTFKFKDQCVDRTMCGDTSKHIQKIAELKPMAKVFKDTTFQGSLAGMSICLSHTSHMAEDTFMQLQSKHGQGLACILRYLLCNSPSVPIPTGQDYSALTVLGQVIHLSVSNTAAVAMETEVSSVHIDVKVRSEPSAAAAAHAAIVRRMEALESDAAQPPLPVREMKKQLHKLQELEEDLRTMSRKDTAKQDFTEITSLYERLRSLAVV